MKSAASSARAPLVAELGDAVLTFPRRDLVAVRAKTRRDFARERACAIAHDVDVKCDEFAANGETSEHVLGPFADDAVYPLVADRAGVTPQFSQEFAIAGRSE